MLDKPQKCISKTTSLNVSSSSHLQQKQCTCCPCREQESMQSGSQKGQARKSQAVNLKGTEGCCDKQEVTEPLVSLERLTVSSFISVHHSSVSMIKCFNGDQDSDHWSYIHAEASWLGTVSRRRGNAVSN